MQHTLDIELGRARGALLRVLALLERRGFAIVRVVTDDLLGEAPDPARVALTVRGQLPIDVLTRHLQRLIDVRTVTSQTPPFSTPDAAAGHHEPA